MSTAEYIVGAIGDLAAWVLGGLLLFWLLRLAVLLVGMSPLPPRAKASMLRLAPVVELLVAVAYVAAALVVLLTEEPEFAWVLIALVVALELVDAGAESPQETKVRLVLVRGGFPPLQTQLPDLGYRLDMGWRKWKVAVEYDGRHHFADARQIE